ncbi:hypothetical protein [Cupriavidus taiwanensis]|uniref:hypothetical protein n=1 Tax=Cupriavidus taiwanensis TaxID=164546 RepID=UPI000E187FC9|nr:hypothetical protein [Cupriavidus taiwanensis]SOZ54815.1 conserved hypothetical protein [Cupriavidus taiwanensis]SOZ78354.1 conserved hypothetical protein [Cupriavidus taiwanensis]SOZ78515.1 conserved hypothetical protein [Cupriavidus taiwanensis]SOZ85468.1 conserved hypothetical protein [Cupriavidus taiwanensis]SPA44664.1 conserved hypothetical protein [Cupriavidus taiwanensis]
MVAWGTEARRGAVACQRALTQPYCPPFSRFAAGTCRYNARRRKIPVATHKSQQIRIIIVYTQQLTRCPRVALPGNPVEGAFIMELLLSLLVGCGISLILFYRK